MNIPITLSKSFGSVSSNLTVTYNRNNVQTNNLFSGKQNIESILGINGVSQNPLDYGLPSLSFTNYSSLNDIRPSLRLNQVYSLGESLGWFHGKHNVRFGGDYRYTDLNAHSYSTARGTFTFNGQETGLNSTGASISGTGYDFADFLLGLPATTSIQSGNGYRLLGHSYDGFIQDDWRALGKVTFNLGLRYDFAAPIREANNRLVNLDAAPGFGAIAAVLPGQTGPFTGAFPLALVNPDRNNFSPQVGIAWRAFNRTIIRAGYGVTFNTGVYNSMVAQLAAQPPFSVTETNVASSTLPLTLQNGFPAPMASTLTNNFGVDKNYQVGYAQTWNLSVQRELPRALTLSVDYTGTKGTRLDILQAPNRTATGGVLLANVQPYTWESSVGDSTSNVGRILLRRRLQSGFSIGGAYTYSKAIDDASSFGAGAGNVAQNALNLDAERALSNYDQRHRFNGDFVFQLLFGVGRKWLISDGATNQLFGGWLLNGTWDFGTGNPLTANITGATSEIKTGTNGVLRANATGQPVKLAHPTALEWFNTAAFSIPADGTYGNAARNTITGPGTRSFNLALRKTYTINDKPMDLSVQATNAFNSPVFRGVNTTVNSPLFGQVTSISAMRTVQIVARYRF